MLVIMISHQSLFESFPRSPLAGGLFVFCLLQAVLLTCCLVGLGSSFDHAFVFITGARSSHKISPWSCLVLELHLVAKHKTPSCTSRVYLCFDSFCVSLFGIYVFGQLELVFCFMLHVWQCLCFDSWDSPLLLCLAVLLLMLKCCAWQCLCFDSWN